jgi:hypothetical protein
MYDILHCVITSIENDRLRQLIENMKFNKKHYEDYVEKRLKEKHYFYMDNEFLVDFLGVEKMGLLDDLPYKNAQMILQGFEGTIVNYHFNKHSKRIEGYLIFEIEGLDEYTLDLSLCHPIDINFFEQYMEGIRLVIDDDYEEE